MSAPPKFWALGTQLPLEPPRSQDPSCLFRPSSSTCENVLDLIGGTPLVKLNKIPQEAGVQCTIYAKLEFFNPGGSIKDRIALRMVEEAERDGFLIPGVSTVVEPTSGNTGIALALVCAIKGYPCIFVMPDRMSPEKANLMKGLGAKLILTPSNVAYDSDQSHFAVAKRLVKENRGFVIMNQYDNIYNQYAHYETTGPEIYEQTQGRVSMLVASAGTGGTLSGIGRFLKTMRPEIKVVAGDPFGSIVAHPPILNETPRIGPARIEGVGHDFVPTSTQYEYIDRWYKRGEKQCFQMAREIIKKEGILAGGTSGMNLDIALQACKDFQLSQSDVCVVVFPDSIRNYMTGFLDDKWMTKHEYL